MYIFIYTSTKYVKIRIFIDYPGSSVWASILFWAGCPGLFWWNIPMIPGSGVFAIALQAGRTVKRSARERWLRQLLF